MNSRHPRSREERIEQAIRGIFAVLFACVPIVAAGVLWYFLVLRP